MENEIKGSNSTEQLENVDSADDFFDRLEAEVNGEVFDPLPQVTTEKAQDSGSDEATRKVETANVGEINWEDDNNPYKKRYSDSSKEAQKIKGELDGLKPFMPVLDVMKSDSGLVDHVRQYLLEGGTPAKSVQEEVGVGADFQYNEQQALTDPNSDSAKVLNAHVDKLVEKRVEGMIQSEKAKTEQIQEARTKKDEQEAFKKKYGMTNEEFDAMVSTAKNHKLTLEDVYFLVNKDKAAANVADSTKKEMLSQMKNVRSIPKSNSNVNSAGTASKSQDDTLFESILGSDGDLDSLFG